MDNNNEKKRNSGKPVRIAEQSSQKREDTPSEKILKLALERDKVYDRCKSLSNEIKEAKEKNQDYNFLTVQFNHMDDYKKVLGDQIKKLIDETQNHIGCSSAGRAGSFKELRVAGSNPAIRDNKTGAKK